MVFALNNKMDGKKYSLGLFGRNALICDEEVIHYYYSVKNEEMVLVCEKDQKKMMMKKRKGCSDNYLNIDENEIEKSIVKQISEDGSRWEGDWYIGKPFGFGSLFDGEGNRIYVGFMFKGEKIGFGEEFFSDNHKVDYCGHFINDKRHGWGNTYDRNGQKLYEGDWRFGKNSFEDEKIVIEDNCEGDDVRIHNLIKELEIGENCLNEWRDDLVIENYPNLESIIVKKNSLRDLNSLKICNCEKLRIIETGDYSFGKVSNVLFESILKLLL